MNLASGRTKTLRNCEAICIITDPLRKLFIYSTWDE